MHVIDFALGELLHQSSEINLTVFSRQLDNLNTLAFKVFRPHNVVVGANQQGLSALENLQIRIQTEIGVHDDFQRLASNTFETRRHLRIICQHGPEPGQHRAADTAPEVPVCTGFFRSNPLALAVGKRCVAVHTHGHLSADPGHAFSLTL